LAEGVVRVPAPLAQVVGLAGEDMVLATELLELAQQAKAMLEFKEIQAVVPTVAAAAEQDLLGQAQV